MACEYVVSRQPTQVTILSDSQAVIMAITNPILTSQTVTQTVDAINLISRKGHNVLLRWVEGYNGAQGKEMADYQANLGAASRPKGPKPVLPFSNAVIKMAAREDLQYNWSDKWQHREKGCRQTIIFFPEPIMALSKSILSLNRRILGMLNPTCRLCGQGREESQHIIRTCLALADIRLAQLWQLEITDASWFLNGIIGFLESPRG
jgi:hypothetical protein